MMGMGTYVAIEAGMGAVGVVNEEEGHCWGRRRRGWAVTWRVVVERNLSFVQPPLNDEQWQWFVHSYAL